MPSPQPIPSGFQVHYGEYLLVVGEGHKDIIPTGVLVGLDEDEIAELVEEIAAFGTAKLSDTVLTHYTGITDATKVEMLSGYGVYPADDLTTPLQVFPTEQAAWRWVDQRYGLQWDDLFDYEMNPDNWEEDTMQTKKRAAASYILVDGPQGVDVVPAASVDLAEVKQLAEMATGKSTVDLAGTTLEGKGANTKAWSIQIAEGDARLQDTPEGGELGAGPAFEDEDQAFDFLTKGSRRSYRRPSMHVTRRTAAPRKKKVKKVSPIERLDSARDVLVAIGNEAENIMEAISALASTRQDVRYELLDDNVHTRVLSNVEAVMNEAEALSQVLDMVADDTADLAGFVDNVLEA